MKHQPSFNMDTWVHNQVNMWKNMKSKVVPDSEQRPFITISREYGCDALGLANELAEILNEVEGTDQWHFYDKELLAKIQETYDVEEKLLETIDTVKRNEMKELLRTMFAGQAPQSATFMKMMKTIRILAYQGRKIIIGRGGVGITRDLKYGLHLRLIAPLNFRIKKAMERKDLKDRQEAEALVKKMDHDREKFVNQYVKYDIHDSGKYHATLNEEKLNRDDIKTIVVAYLSERGYLKIK